MPRLIPNDPAATVSVEAIAETVRTGWWTTCLEVLPARERARGRF